MVRKERTTESRAIARQKVMENYGEDYFQRKVIIHRNMKNGTLPTQRVIEKYNLTPEEIMKLNENAMNKLLKVKD